MKNFEKHLHDHFDGREVNVDKNELWANIAPQLEPAKKDRKKSWFFFFLGLTAGVALLGLYMFTQVEEQPIVDATSRSATTETSAIAANSNANKAATKSLNTAEKSAETLSIDTPSNTNTTEAKSTAIKNIADTQNTTNKIHKNFNTYNNKTTNKTTANKTKSATFQTSHNKTNTSKNTSDIPNTIIPKEATTTLVKNDLLRIPSLATNAFANADINIDKLPKLTKTPADDLITPSRSKLRVGIGFHAGISKTQNMLRERSQSEFLYTQLRASTEDQLQTVHLGLSAVVEIKRNIYIQAGLEYSRINSKLNLDDELILIDTVQNLIIRHGNFTDTIGAGDQFIVQEFSKNNRQNSFHLVDLPILFGYQFGKARWRAGIEAGAYINLRLQKEGQVLNEDLSLYDLDKDQNNWYKPNVGIRPHLGLVSTYDLSSNYQLYFSTGITFNKLFSMNNSPITVEKSMFGMRVGGRYYF